MTAAANRKPTAERELVLTRVFDAPRELMWKLWTQSLERLATLAARTGSAG